MSLVNIKQRVNDLEVLSDVLMSSQDADFP